MIGQKLSFNATVSYADVDRAEVMLLPRIFKLLQEAAIMHANQFGTGTQAALTRAETWVLSRIAVGIERYPRHDETLRVETWSSGIKGFKGLRDFRVYDAEQCPIISATSVWLYVSLKTKSIVRVPGDIAGGFPVCAEGVWCPELERMPFEPPGPEGRDVAISLRYSDFDANGHVNNAAYLDFVQSALARSVGAERPRRVRVNFARAIPAGAESVAVRLEPRGDRTRFSIEQGGVSFARGETEA